MAACLRDFGQCDVEAILLENSGFLGKRQRSKAGPAGKAKETAVSACAADVNVKAASAAPASNDFFMCSTPL